MKRSPLTANPQTTAAWQQRSVKPAKRRAISPATPEQRQAIHDRPCLACSDGPCHPAHLIDRSLCPDRADDARAVVPLCPSCHRAYDLHSLSLLEFLEPGFRVELAFAVERFGLISTLERVTGEKWRPQETPAGRLGR